MPVLLNNSTNQLENLPDDASAQSALVANTHTVPLVDPQGTMGSASPDDASQLLAQGYTQPSPDQLQSGLDAAHYASLPQHLLGDVEQVGQGLAGPLATGAELAMGVKPKDIEGRAAALSTPEKMVGQGAGLVGGMLVPGGGEARVLELAGEGGLHALGLAGEATSTLGRIGTVAAKAAIENAVYQSGDEMTKSMLGDPNQSVGSVVANVGLASVIGAGTGGVFGTVPEVWARTMGPKADALLQSLTNRANGVTAPMSPELATVLEQSEKMGVPLPPEMKAGLSDDPVANQAFRDLQESGTPTGDALRETINNTQDGVKGLLAKSITPDQPMTSFEAGEAAKKAIGDTNDQFNAANRAAYDKTGPSAEVRLPDDAKLEFATKLTNSGAEFGAVGSPAQKLFENYSDRVLAQNTIGQLDKLDTEIGAEANVAHLAGDSEKRRALGQIQEQLRDFKDSTLDSEMQTRMASQSMGVEGAPGAGPQDTFENMKADRAAARAGYANYKSTMGDLFSVAKMGKAGSYQQIAEALEKVPSAKLADKLFDPKNIEGLRTLQSDYPEIFKSIVNAKKTALLESVTAKGELQHNQLMTALGKMPKEVRDMMFTPEQRNIVEAGGKILRDLGKRNNSSGTAMTLDKMWQHIPAGVGQMAAWLTGHNPLVGYFLGHATKFISRDAPDAVKMSLLKFLGSTEHVDAGAWKVATDFLNASIKGDNMVRQAVKGVLKAGQVVLPQSKMPDDASRAKLDRKLQSLQEDPAPMFDVGGKTGHYLPQHQVALSATAANAVQYLNGLRPQVPQQAPLDTKFEPTSIQQENFNAALDIAQQPLTVLQHVKDGTLLPSHLTHLQNLYPNLQASMQKKMMEELANHVGSDGKDMSLDRLQSLSQFMGQPLESSLIPANMQALQNPPPPPPMAQGPKGGSQKHSFKDLGKIPEASMTPSQAREQSAQTQKT